MKKIRWGVIGAGGIARRRTIPEGILVADNSTLIAVYSPHSGFEVAQEFGATACRSEAELLGLDIDAVYVATPVYLHAEQVLRAAKAGKRLLCEKPLGMSVAEAEQMVAACSAAGVKLGTALMMRFHAQNRRAFDLIREGAIGRPVLARAQLSCWYPPISGAWRQEPSRGGGGALVDLGSHCIDLLESLIGPAKSVSCSTTHLVHDYAVEDGAIVQLEFESGAHGIVDVMFNVPDDSSRNRLEIYGTQGSILAEGTIGQSPLGEMTLHRGRNSPGYDAAQERGGPVGEPISPKPVNTYCAQISAFAGALMRDTAPPVDGAAGLRLQRLLSACYLSAESGRAVML